MSEYEAVMDNVQDMTTTELDNIPQPTLEQLERQVTAVLYAIWRARGINKRVVELRKEKESDNGPTSD